MVSFVQTSVIYVLLPRVLFIATFRLMAVFFIFCCHVILDIQISRITIFSFLFYANTQIQALVVHVGSVWSAELISVFDESQS